MKYIKKFEIKEFSNYDFKVGDIVKLISLNLNAKQLNARLGIDIKKGDLCKIINFSNFDNKTYKIVPLKYKNIDTSYFFGCDLWVSRKQVETPTEFELNILKYNL